MILYKNNIGDKITIEKYKKNVRIGVFTDNSGFSCFVEKDKILNYLK